MNGHSEKVAFIWSVADLLRGSYKARDYGKVILPFVVLRRLDCLLETRKGYEIPFTRHFYQFEPLRPLAEIDADLRRVSTEIQEMLREIAA